LQHAIEIQLANKIRWAFEQKATLNVKTLILVGGRASTKSTAAADVVLAYAQSGQRWCCAREFLNSIDDSCQALLTEEIDRIGFQGFTVMATEINHASGGAIFHKGLSRNPASIKSVVADGIWIEEGEKLGEGTIKILSASFRISAAKQERAKRAGEEAKIPDIIITMNRGNSKDPISQEYLKAAEPTIKKQGWYADEDVLIVEVNYTDIPKAWFTGSGLEAERLRDERLMSRAEYDHKWHGAYSDSVQNAIIPPEWFDACIDAHIKLAHLGEFGHGQERVAFDPADVGPDPEALAHRRGNIIVEAMQADQKDIEAACNWACSYANLNKVDAFIWDCDGMGVGLKSQISTAFKDRPIMIAQFKGSEGALNPDAIYQPVDDEKSKPLKNKDAFANQRGQFYFELREAMHKTWLAVEKGRYFPVDDLISFSSSIKHLTILRSEICSIPRKYIASGRMLLMTKAEMLKMGITSPNISDCVMMLMKPAEQQAKPRKLKPMRGWGA
jgi:phage terminase large subunit